MGKGETYAICEPLEHEFATRWDEKQIEWLAVCKACGVFAYSCESSEDAVAKAGRAAYLEQREWFEREVEPRLLSREVVKRWGAKGRYG